MGQQQYNASRRQLIIGAAGGAAALAATAIAPATALAGVDGDVVLGAANSTTTPTTITNTTADLSAFTATSTGEGDAITGTSPDGVGVRGTSTNWIGLVGLGDIGVDGGGRLGVLGETTNANGAGVLGQGKGATCGVCGVVGTEALPGVGIGVHAIATDTALTALRVDGRASFSRSGRLGVAKGKSSVTKSVAGVKTSSIVLATLQQAESGTWVRGAVAGTGKFTIYFNRALPSSSIVGWFVIN